MAYVLLATAVVCAHEFFWFRRSAFSALGYQELGGIVASAVICGAFLIQGSKPRTSLLTGWGMGSLAARRLIPLALLVPLFPVCFYVQRYPQQARMIITIALWNELVLAVSFVWVSIWLNRVEQPIVIESSTTAE
jgi:hypothetical protein